MNPDLYNLREKTAVARQEWVESTLARLSLEEKIGQLFMVTFAGTEISPELVNFLLGHHIGGVTIGGRNITSPAQIAALNLGLQSAFKNAGAPPLLVSLTQEGGIVTRWHYPATIVPSAMAIGATGSLELAKECARVTARELRAAGFNLNFAPTVDVNNNPLNPVIGTRSYGEVPEQVARFAVAAILGQREVGLASCAKHFPGHGDTSVDSHLGLPVIPHGLERLEEVELVPFRAAIAAGVETVMTVHILFPALDGQRPATLSRAVLTGLLRERLGFAGLIITDSMTMEAIAANYDLGEAAVLALEAGADILLTGGDRKTQEEMYQAVLKGVENGRLGIDQIEKSLRRILGLKWDLEVGKDLGLYAEQSQQSSVGHSAAPVVSWPVPGHLDVARTTARRSLTLVRDRDGLVPLRLTPGQKLALIEFRLVRFSLVEESRRTSRYLSQLFQSRYHGVTSLTLDPSPSQGEKKAARDLAAAADLVVVATRNTNAYEEQARLVRELLALDKPVVVLAIRNPYDLAAIPEVGSYLITYGDAPVSLEAAVACLFGDFAPVGRLPVTLPVGIG
ncbi:MAG: glycoside hydrolase family 3 protein [Firmicutes bacterium]|nr:glycoside hydrolase family 3 protein [Bacillota bacterium]